MGGPGECCGACCFHCQYVWFGVSGVKLQASGVEVYRVVYDFGLRNLD